MLNRFAFLFATAIMFYPFISEIEPIDKENNRLVAGNLQGKAAQYPIRTKQENLQYESGS